MMNMYDIVKGILRRNYVWWLF